MERIGLSELRRKPDRFWEDLPGREPMVVTRRGRPIAVLAPVKGFDCVQFMRDARDRISREIQGMSYPDFVRYLRNYRYSDPYLQRLADEAFRGNRTQRKARSRK